MLVKRSRLAAGLPAFVLVLSIATPSGAYFCGDPLADNCSVPKESPTPGKRESPVNVNPHPTETFVLIPGKSFKENLDEWGKASGWTVLWHSEYNFPVKARFTAGRSFLGAVRRSIRIFNAGSGGWLKVRAYLSNHVLLVEDGR